MATSLVFEIYTRVALIKGWVNSFLAFMGQLYIGFYTYEELIAKGVRFLRPPIDHPWGKRTAPFADPEGNLWEISQDIPAKAEP